MPERGSSPFQNRDEKGKGERKSDSRSEALRQLGPYMGLGWILAISLLVGTFGGVYLDRWLGTSPWLTLLGIALGMAAGLTSVLRTTLNMDRERKRRFEKEDRS